MRPVRSALTALILAVPAPLLAAAFDCRMQQHCTMPEGGCTDLPDAPAMRVELAGDLSSGTLAVGDLRLELRLIARQDRGDTYLTVAENGAAGFLTLMPDGRFLSSSHEFGQDPILVTAANGTCARSET